MATRDVDATEKYSRSSFNFDALEKLGCSKRFSEKRIQMYRIAAACGTELIRQTQHEDIYTIIAGSRGEGIYISCDSDVDILFIQRTVKCFEHVQIPLEIDKSSCPVIFQLDFTNVPPGYSRLRLISLEKMKSWPRTNFEFLTNLKYALIQKNSHKYLRNDQLLTTTFRNNREGCIRQQSVFADITGPARTFRCEMPLIPEISLSVDCVLAFTCQYPSLLRKWCKRERQHSWPNKDLIEKVWELGVLVVPAGYKGSTDEELQWRISLTLAEQALVHSFNDIQIKLYIALKLLATHEFKPICDHITSYIVKNCIFWTFENNEIKDFTKKNFDSNLLKILQFLKSCINWKYLPNYMNPSMNMLQNKITEKKKCLLLRRLNFLTFDCSHAFLLLRCPLVNEIMFLSADELEQRIAFRDLVEQLYLSVNLIIYTHPDLTYFIWDNFRRPDDVYKTLFEQVLPLIRKYNPMSFFERLKSISDKELLSLLLCGITHGYHKST